jgi:UDP-N-acetylmuramate--alanine ligase
VAGTHGKTTTTSMVAALLDAGGIDPTVINGGIINSLWLQRPAGRSDWMVVEADESDGSFLRLDGTIAVVTNIDPEHLDHYGRFRRGEGRLRRVHRERALLWRGGAVHRSSRSAGADRRGARPAGRHLRLSAQADVRGENVTPVPAATASMRGRCARARRHAPDRGHGAADAGPHNVQNALAAIAVALEMGVPTM